MKILSPVLFNLKKIEQIICLVSIQNLMLSMVFFALMIFAMLLILFSIGIQCIIIIYLYTEHSLISIPFFFGLSVSLFILLGMNNYLERNINLERNIYIR